MERAFWDIYLAMAAVAVLQAFLLALQTWEHRRFARSRMRELDKASPRGRAAVFCPCKGVDVGLENNLRAILRQDYSDYEVVFIVESAEDPACRMLRRIVTEYAQVKTRLVVAGPAAGCGQKVHNLRAGTADLDPAIRYVVFVDSDARPRPQWLRSLLRLDRPGVGASTGYRWFIPTRPSLANSLLYSINCGIALLFGPSHYHLIWGGSWAMRRELFEQLGVREAWKGTLSDDLVVSRLVRRAGLGVIYQPPCMVASPLDYPGSAMFSFLRRQYLVARFYAPRHWLMGLASGAIVNVVMLSSLIMTASGLVSGRPSFWIPLGVLGALYGIGVVRASVRQSLATLFFPSLQPVLRRARRFDVWAGPLASLVNWIGIVSSLLGREMVWRGFRYRLSRGGQIQLVGRGPAAEENHETEEDLPAELRALAGVDRAIMRKKAG
jgi:hypothetical protein